jgi:anti-anti-sigma regulatory factor
MHSGQTPRIINLQGSLGVDRAATLKTEISEALSASDNVLLSVSLVEDIDLACLQVLYAARAQASRDGKELHFLGSVPSRVSKRLVACGYLRGVTEHADDFESALVGF